MSYFQRINFLVTKNIKLSKLKFIITSDLSFLGRELDVEARAPLWRAGLDYGHGTGHGIGYFLSVHECKSFK